MYVSEAHGYESQVIVSLPLSHKASPSELAVLLQMRQTLLASADNSGGPWLHRMRVEARKGKQKGKIGDMVMIGDFGKDTDDNASS